MNSTAEATLKKLKQVTREVSLIANLLLPSSKECGKVLTPLLRKLQKEKDALVKRLEKTKYAPVATKKTPSKTRTSRTKYCVQTVSQTGIETKHDPK